MPLMRKSHEQVLILQQLKIFFGESSSVRLRGPNDFPLMPRLPLVEELSEAASRSMKMLRNPGTLFRNAAFMPVARVTKI